MPASDRRAAAARSPLKRHLPRLLSLLFALVSCGDQAPTGPALEPAASLVGESAGVTVRPAVVIGQIYGGGGNTGAPYTHDFVELFNTTGEAVDVSGWRIHYASAAGTSWTNTTTLPAGAVIPAGGYYLVQQAGGATGVALPAPDAMGGIAMAAGSGKLVLTSEAVGLPSAACPDPASLVDRVAYGTTAAGSCGEWPTTPTLTNATAALRNDAGCAYGQSVFTAATPAPRNSSSAAHSCEVVDDEVASVTVSPPSAAIGVGATQAFTATAANAGGQTVAAALTWSSSDEAVATVNATTGVATGVATGTATITATAANGVTGTASLNVSAVAAPSYDVVISQLYGGGGNSGATLTHDFVELFNRGATPVDVSGWMIHYASSTGSTWNNTATIGEAAVIPAGGYFLVQLATNNANVGEAMPAPDATGGINMAAGAGKVVVTLPGASLSGTCPEDATIVDRVNYGSANCSATWGQTPTLSATLAAFRSGGGCVQTGSSSADFTTALPAPRNSSSLRNVCAGPATAVVAPAGATVQAGGTVAFTATGFTADGHPTAASFTWSSSDVAVATVHPTSGTATAVAAGTATITALAANGVTASATLEVTQPPPATGLVITEFMANPEGDDTLGEWFEIFNAGATAVDLFGWHLRSNSSTGIEAHTIGASVIVPAGGFVVLGNNADANTNGGVAIAYSYGADIILNNSNTDWLTLKRPDGTLEDSVSYSARDGTGTIVSPQFTPANATARELINENLDNSVAATGNWRNATMTYGDGRNRGSPGWGAYGIAGPVASVVVAPASGAALVGGNATFTSLALDALGRVSTETMSWSSSDPAIASVHTSTGVATGHAEGIVTITATAASGVSGTATLAIVDAESPATLTVGISDPGYFIAGMERRLFATVRNWQDVVISPTPPVTWTVTPSHLARVNTYIGADGFARTYIEALAPGSVEIRGTAANGVFGVRGITILPADAPTSAVYRNHVEFGMPTPGGTVDDIIIERLGFVSSWNQTRGGPNWVSWNLNATHFGGVSRCDCFSPDPLLPPDVQQVFDSDYIGSGYDRGHMVQSESRTTTLQENAATFYFTNILPQAAANNQQSWLAFENHLNNLARTQSREVYVIAGGEYVASPQTINNAGRIQIPDWTWKIAVVLDAGSGLADVHDPSSLEVLAVRMPNLVSTAVPTSDWQQFTTTVHAIEQATGFDFLAALPDWIEAIVEGRPTPPVVTGITVPVVAEIGTAAAVTVTWTDAGSADTHTVTIDWGDGSSTTVAGTNGTTTATHAYAATGFFTVSATVVDNTGASGSGSAATPIAVYDPNGAVSGGGAYGSGSERASLAFSARHRGSGLGGNLELHVPGSELRFTASAFDYLVTEGGRATLQGTGTLHAVAGTFSFTLVAQEGRGGSGAVRVVIRDDAGEIVHDNAPDAEPGVLVNVNGNINVR